VAATAALNGSDAVIEEVRNVYRNRRDVMVESFGRAGWDIPMPKATMFAWAPIPDQFAHLGSLEFAKLLIQETGVAVAPGVGFGEYGDQYIRLAFVENEQRIRQAARNIKKFLAGGASHGNVVPLQAAK
jgi:alanine-synthesizing transaminase